MGIWTNSSSKGMKGVHVGGSERSDSFEFTDAMATAARAPPGYTMAVKQEWAFISIHIALEGLLDAYALGFLPTLVKFCFDSVGVITGKEALKAAVRLQALFRGCQGRQQATSIGTCMQALVQVQAQVRA